MKTIVIVDTSAYIHKNYHARPPFMDKNGKCNRVSLGIFSLLKKIDDNMSVDDVVFALDSNQGSLYRKDLFQEYKAHRPEKEEELVRQEKELIRILTNTGIQVVQKDGFEADDLIGSLAVSEANNGTEVAILSPDKDILQLVSDKIHVMKVSNSESNKVFDFYNTEQVRTDIGVYPQQIPDLLALMGDVADNIPGINGIGLKTAVKIINEVGNIENLIKDPELIKRIVKNPKILNDFYLKVGVLDVIKKLTTILVNVDVITPELDKDLFANKKHILRNHYNFPEYLLNFDFIGNKTKPYQP